MNRQIRRDPRAMTHAQGVAYGRSLDSATRDDLCSGLVTGEWGSTLDWCDLGFDGRPTTAFIDGLFQAEERIAS